MATFLFLILLKLWKYNQLKNLPPPEEKTETIDINEKDIYNTDFANEFGTKNTFLDSEERWKKLYQKK